MNRFLAFIILIFASVLTFAQSKATQTGEKFLRSNSEDFDLSINDISEKLISDMYTTKHNGVTHIYYNQARNGVPVHNAIFTVNVNRDGNVLFHSNEFIKDLDAKINTQKALVSPEQAIIRTAEALGEVDIDKPTLLKKQQDGTMVFQESSYSRGAIRVKKYYYPTGDEVKLAWEVAYHEREGSDSWASRVDAVTAELIDIENRTIYCQHHPGQFHNHSAECRDMEEQSAKPGLEELSMEGSYRVYPIPLESPIHGSQELVTAPHLVEASPFGWHDIDGAEGPEYTITRGNNVHAYNDDNNDNLSEDDEPDGGAALVFDFIHRQEEEPDSNELADVVNLFYGNNIIHDISYLMGFDEQAGNFQFNNYGNGGLDSDFVIAHSLDGSGVNNANFSLAPDGVNGNMNMFRWGVPQSTLFSVTEPAELDFNYQNGTASGGWGFDESYNSYDFVAELAAAYDSDPQFSNNVCGPVANPDEIDGKIAMIYRGRCEFGTKALNAQEAGAVAVIICNVPGAGNDPTSDGNEPMGMAPGRDGLGVTIPVFSLGFADCNQIVLTIEAGTPVMGRIKAETSNGPSELSSGFDNGVVFHEYGHGISSRLTGGPSAICLNSDEQMGEGWSDFFALALTVEPGDRGEDARGIGTYVSGEDVNGRGIRRYPYSTDMSINPQTFKDIKATTAPHPLGEIWVDMLWDIFWRYVDKYGYDADWTNSQSGNYQAVQLVLDGLKMQGCSPGFVRGRDALLAADVANTGGENTCLIWEAFARRGLGYFADGGSANNRNDGTEDFTTLPLCEKTLKIYKNIPELLNLDSEVEVELIVANHIDSTVTDLVVSDEFPAGMSPVSGSESRAATIIGNQIFFDYDSLQHNQWDTIRYRLQYDNTVNSTILFSNAVESNEELEEWERILIQDQTNIFRLNSSSTFPTYSGENCWFVTEIDDDTEAMIQFANIEVNGEKPAVRFWHRMNTEFARNGGFVEISTDGIIWNDARPYFLRNGYECPLAFTTFAIPALQAFSGRSEADQYIDSYIDLSSFKGQTLTLRFRFGTNSGEGNEANDETFPFDSGWFIDDLDLIDLSIDDTEACISTSNEQACSGGVMTVLNPQMLSSSSEELVQLSGLKIYPNPASDLVNIEINASESDRAYIEMSDVSGRLIYRDVKQLNKNINLLQLNTADYKPGVYFILLQTKQGIASQKLIIE